MSVSKFRVAGRLDMASKVTEGTVVIDRGAGLFTVRPLRKRKVYTLPLSSVAEMVVMRITKAELLEKRLAKRGRRARRKKA